MRQSQKMTLCGVLALVGLLGTAGPGRAEDNALTRESLRDLPGVRVLIEALPAAATRTGLTETHLQTTVMVRLRNAGVPILTAAAWRETPGTPLLYIQVQTVNSAGAYAYAIRVQLFQQVVLARSLLCTHAITWDTGSVGRVGGANARQTLRQAGTLRRLDGLHPAHRRPRPAQYSGL
jgi:hypothetical protein